MTTNVPPFPLVNLAIFGGHVPVPSEPIDDTLAITPCVGTLNGRAVLTGTFTLTHRPTGRTVVDGEGCIECCRSAGRQIAALGLDFSAVTAENSRDWADALPQEVATAFATARTIWCEVEFCSDDEEDGEDQ